MKKVMLENELFTNTIKSHPLFGLSKKLPKIESIKGFLGFINVLLVDWILYKECSERHCSDC